MRRVVAVIALTAVFVLAVEVTASFILGRALRQLFSEGTGCKVTFDSPWLSFFPLGASLKHAVIRHPSEGAAGGLTVEKATARLEFWPLLKKRVVLNRLRLHGLSAVSKTQQNGLFNTIDYIARDEPLSPPAWHDAFSSGWSVLVRDIHISGRDGAAPALIVSVGKHELQWGSFQVAFLRESLDRLIYNVSATASRLHYERAAFGQADFSEMQADGKLGDGVLTLSKVAISEPGWGEILAQGEIDFGAQYDIAIIPRLSAALLRSGFLPEAPAAVVPDILGNLRLHGAIDQPVLSGVLNAWAPSDASPCLPRTLQVELALSEDGLRVLRGRSESQSFENLRTELRFDDPLSLNGELVLAVLGEQDLLKRCFGKQLAAHFGADDRLRLGVAGTLFPLRLQLNATLSASSRALQTQVAFALSSETVEGDVTSSVADGSVRFGVRHSWRSRLWEITDGVASAYPLTVALQLMQPMLDPQLRGRIDGLGGAARLSGRAKLRMGDGERSGEGEVEIRDLAYHGIALPRAAAAWRVLREEFDLRPIVVTTLGGVIEGELLSRQHGLTGFIQTTGITIPSAHPWARYLPSWVKLIRGKVNLTGTTQTPRYEGRLEVESESPAVLGSTVNIRGDGAQFVLGGLLAGGQSRLDLTRGAGGVISAALRAERLPLDYLTPSSLPIVPQGVVSGRAEYVAQPDNLFRGRGEISITELEATLRGQGVGIEQPLLMEVRDGRLHFLRFGLQVDGQEIFLSGTVGSKGGWNAAVRGNWDLATLAVKPLEQLDGTIAADLAVQGPLAAPAISGKLALDDGAFVLNLGSGRVLAADELSGEAEFRDGALFLHALSGDLNSGEFELHGELHNIFQAGDAAVELQFHDVLFSPVERLSLSLNGKLDCGRRTGKRWNVGGTVMIAEGEYENILDLESLLGQLVGFIRGVEAKRRSSRLEPTTVDYDVRVRTDRSVVVDTNIFQAEVGADLRLYGNSSEPLVDGSLEVVEGVFGFQATQFEIIRGALVFSPQSSSVDPRIQLLAESDVGRDGAQSLVRIAVSGTVLKPSVSFSSDAGLSEREILAQLGVGFGAERFTLLNKPERSSVKRLLNPRSTLTLADRLGGLTGISKVEVGSAFSETTGEIVPILVLKRDLTRSTDLTLESELSSIPTTRIVVEHDLTTFWSALLAWKDSPTTEDPGSTSGSFEIGLGYQRTFSGVTFLPPGFFSWSIGSDDD